MTWALAVAGVALCVAGDLSNGTAVYLWIPGTWLAVSAFARAIRPKPDPRPGYINDRRDHR